MSSTAQTEKTHITPNLVTLEGQLPGTVRVPECKIEGFQAKDTVPIKDLPKLTVFFPYKFSFI